MKRQNLANKLWAWLAVLCLALFYLAGSVPSTNLAGVGAQAAAGTLETPSYNFNYSILQDLGVIDYNQYLLELSQTRDLPEVVIAVLDSGININHPVFAGRILEKYACNFYLNTRTDNVVRDSNWNVDNSGHGSHVAGLIADATLDNVKILPIKIFQGEDNETITGEVIKEAIDYVVDLKSKQNLNIVAMNMSLGTPIMTPSSDYYYWNLVGYQKYIDTLRNAGILPVVAAGNEGKKQAANTNQEWYSLPSACSGTMAVSAYNAHDNKKLADFSNFGAHIRLSAPGVAIESAWKTDYGTQSQVVSGTSMATPFVTLCYAMLMSDITKTTATALGVEWSSSVDTKYPYYYLNVQHKALLLHAVDLGEPGLDTLYGYGGVNVADFAQESGEIPFVPSYDAEEVQNPTVAAAYKSNNDSSSVGIFDNVQNVFWTAAGLIVVILIVYVIRYRFENRKTPKEYPTDE